MIALLFVSCTLLSMLGFCCLILLYVPSLIVDVHLDVLCFPSTQSFAHIDDIQFFFCHRTINISRTAKMFPNFGFDPGFTHQLIVSKIIHFFAPQSH